LANWDSGIAKLPLVGNCVVQNAIKSQSISQSVNKFVMAKTVILDKICLL